MDSAGLTVTKEETSGSAVVRNAAAAPAAPARGQGAKKKNKARRAWWLKQLHSWHWISAAVSLIGMLLFAITGITLNHAASITATPDVTEASASLPAPLLAQLEADPADEHAPLPAPVAAHLAKAVKLDPAGRAAEWSEDEVYIGMPGPGRDAWISIDRATGDVMSEITDRGWISYLNDLHKGRNTGDAWFWFIDVFAVACVVFTITGLFLLQLHAKHRPSTWPIVGLGLVIPVALALFFIH